MAQEQTKAKATISLPKAIAYGGGGMFALTMSASFVSYMLMPFLTEASGFSTAMAATVYSLNNIVKIIAMIASGVIIDRFAFRSGKYRTWCVIGGVVMTIFTGLSMTRFNLPEGAYVVVFLFLFFMNQIGYNLMWTGSRSLVGPMSKNSQDGVVLTTAAQLGSTAGGTVYGLISTGIAAAFAASSQPYAGPAYIYSAFALVGGIVLYLITAKDDGPREISKDEVKQEKPKGVGFGEMLRSIKGQGLIFVVGTTFGNVQMGFFSTLLFYFTSFVLGNPTIAGLAVTVNSIGGIIGALLTPWLCSKMSKKSLYIWSHLISAVLYVMIFLLGRNAIAFLIIRVTLGMVGSPSGVTLPALGNDLADYNEMRGESNARAFVQSMIGVSIRLGMLISGAAASYGLAAVGYVAGTEVSASTATGIMALMGIAPAVVCVIAAVIIKFFNVSEAELDAYRKSKGNA